MLPNKLFKAIFSKFSGIKNKPDLGANGCNYTYSFDSLGGSFKEYVLLNNAPEAIKRLKHGLDKLSCDYIDYCIKSAVDFPDFKLRHLFGNNKDIYNHYYPQWLIDDVKTNIAKNPPVAGYGITALPVKVTEYIRNKIFLDLGAYDGWSVVELSKYLPKKVYSFDISRKNAKIYYETAKRFTVPYELYLVALGDRYDQITFDDLGTSGTNLHSTPRDSCIVQVMPFDDFIDQHITTTEIGFIKIDIEGSEYSAIKGAYKTISKHRPVLSISIYHNPVDFFEIKPLIESWSLNYKFVIRKLSLEYMYTPFIDTVLLLYPSELE